MKIELEVSDISLATDAINNGLIALDDIRAEIFLMGYSKQHAKFNKLAGNNFDNPTETLDKRLDELKFIYDQLLDIEKERGTNDNNEQESN